MSIQALRERAAELNKQANHILAEKGAQTWSVEDQAKFDGLMDEAERTTRQIDAHQRAMDKHAEDNFADATRKPSKPGKVSDAQRGYDLFLRKSDRQLSADEAALIRNTMSTTTGSEGGFTVQTEVASTVIEAIKSFGAMRRVADSLVTAQGNPLSYPTTDGTAEEGEIVAQNQSASDADISFGTRDLGVYKFGSKVIPVPIELLQDTTIDIQALIRARIRSRIGRHQNRKFTVGLGSGSNEPMGMITAASVGKVGATGQTTTITYDDLVDIAESLDIAYTDEAGAIPGWMFPQSLRKTLRKLKDTAGRPIWTPSYDAGIQGTRTDMLLDYPVTINNEMPAPAANAKSLAFGQFGAYVVRDALDITLFRFDDSAYTKKGQVGFLAWARTGGNLMDLSAVKTYQHSAT